VSAVTGVRQLPAAGFSADVMCGAPTAFCGAHRSFTGPVAVHDQPEAECEVGSLLRDLGLVVEDYVRDREGCRIPTSDFDS